MKIEIQHTQTYRIQRKAVLKGKFIEMNTHMKKVERLHINLQKYWDYRWEPLCWAERFLIYLEGT